MDAQYVAVGDDATEVVTRRAQDRRSRFVIGGIAIAVVCVVGIIVGTTSGSNSQNGDSSQSSGSGSPQAASSQSDFSKHFAPTKAVRPQFAVHPVLTGLYDQPGREDPTDPTVTLYSKHVDLVTPNHFTHMHAEVAAVNNAVTLSNISAALRVACAVDRIFVEFESEAAARNFSAKIVADTALPLEEEWNCTVGAHVRKAVGTTSVSGSIVSVPTINASISDLFREANISYNGTGWGTPVYPNSHPTPIDVSGSSRERRSWLSHAWHTIVHVAKAVVTGDVNVDKKLYQTDFTMGPSACLGPGPTSESDVDRQAHQLTQCQFHSGLSIVFQLQVHHYSLELIDLYTEGTMNGDISTNGQSLDHTWSGSYSFTLFHSTIFSISIPVASFPLPIKLVGSMYSHPQWSINGQVTMDADIRTSGELKFGLEYTKATHVRPIHIDTLQATADLNSATGVFTVDGSLGMDAVFELSALYVATADVHIAINPSIHGVATETIMGPGGEAISVNGDNVSAHHIAATQPTTYSACAPTENAHDPIDNPSFQFSADVSVDVTAGANIDVDIMHHQLYEHQFNFGSLYSHDWSFGPWCRHIDV